MNEWIIAHASKSVVAEFTTEWYYLCNTPLQSVKAPLLTFFLLFQILQEYNGN